jgi:hypothetical protein
LRKQIPATTEKTTLASLPTTFVVNEKRLPVNLFTLRQTLYKKAKREPTFRFYSLYGLIARLDVLAAAWDLVADNDGAPGVDGVTIQQIAAAPGGERHWWRRCTRSCSRSSTRRKRCDGYSS